MGSSSSQWVGRVWVIGEWIRSYGETRISLSQILYKHSLTMAKSTLFDILSLPNAYHPLPRPGVAQIVRDATESFTM